MVHSKEVNEGLRTTRDKCLKTSGVPSDGKQSFHCRVTGGVHNGQMCREAGDTSMYERSFLRKAVKGFDDPSYHPLHTIVNHLTDRNLSLILVGDSIIGGVSAAFNCELFREGLKDFDWSSHVNVIRYGFNTNNSLDELRGFPIALMLIREQKDPIVLKKYLTRLFAEQLTVKSGVVLLLNFGVHYNDADRQSYRTHMSNLFNSLENATVAYPSKRFIFVWLESSAQHFQGGQGNGYYQLNKTQCGPIRNTSREADWRNAEVDSILQGAAFFEQPNVLFRVAPFRSLTEPLYDTHVRGNYEDCTHFCWSPMMYMPVFDFLLKAIDTAMLNTG